MPAVASRRAGLHRHPHALRRAGVLGSRADAVVLPRRHHSGRRQLRLLDRADAARAPRADRADAAEGRGHGCRGAGRGHPMGIRDVPRVPRVGRKARHGAQLRRLHRPHRVAALRDGRRAARPHRDRRRDRRDVTHGERGDGRGRRWLRHELRDDASRRRRQAGAQPVRGSRRIRSVDARGRANRAAASSRSRPGRISRIDDMYDVQTARRRAVHLHRACSTTADGQPQPTRRCQPRGLGRRRPGVAAGDAAARSASR